MAELRLIRMEMLAEFPTDEALFIAIKAHEAELIRQGKVVVSPPASVQHPPKPNAA
jgi:hypothetical protein